MPSASIKLANGTSVKIEGTPEEVAKLLALYRGESDQAQPRELKAPSRTRGRSKSPSKARSGPQSDSTPAVDLSGIVNLTKNCDQAEAIEAAILDRTSQVNRILLPLYVVHEHLDNDQGLTSGEISQITKELGIPIHVANVSNKLSKTASKYVMGDKVRKQGQPVRYKLNRRGLKYVRDVLNGASDD